eukprot:TsM_000212000 transcript=TsM_000212000 gene=TsM_000212000
MQAAVECSCLARLSLKRNEMDIRREVSRSSALIGCFCYVGLSENRVACLLEDLWYLVDAKGLLLVGKWSAFVCIEVRGQVC